MHAQRKNLLDNYESEGIAETLISRLESKTGIKAFTIWWDSNLPTRQPEAASWPIPSVALARSTPLGAADFASYYTASVRFSIRDGKLVPISRDQRRALPMAEQFDAILYLGSFSATTYTSRHLHSVPSRATCRRG
jgi:hypothetical protein